MAAPAAPVALIPPQPGISKKDSELSLSDRWIDGDKVRFVDGKPEKIGGNTELLDIGVENPIRGLLAWSTQQLQTFLGFGTHRKLYVADQALNAIEITPIGSSGTLTDPFTMTAGSADILVTHTSHGRTVGDEVRYPDGSSLTAGITISGTYTVIAVLDENIYQITHSAVAVSDATGGGSVNYEYELSIGAADPAEGDGYGAGGYGLGDYGVPAEDGADSIVFEPRVWNLDRYGDDMLCNPVNGSIYLFDPTDTPAYQRATILANAPTVCRCAFVTDERFIFACGVDNDPLNIKWPDQNDPTNWTPGSTTTANSRRLREGTRIIAGKSIGNLLTGVLTDTALYQFQYTGSSFIYDSKLAGTNCGLVSPLAMQVILGVMYWMSQRTFFMWGGGAPQQMPNVDDVREFVRKALRMSGYEYKCNSHFNATYNELWFFYVTAALTEPGRYIAVSLNDYSWVCGEMERTSGTFFKGSDQRPILAGADGLLYQHEDGKDDNGAIMRAFIKRGPMQILEGTQLGEVHGLVADMSRHIGTLSVEVNTYDRINAGVLDNERAFFDPGEDLVDLRIGGRIADVTIRSESLGGDFRLGSPMLEVIATGKRR